MANAKRIFCLLSGLFIILFFTGCGNDNVRQTKEVYLTLTDDAGRTVPLEKKPERIVALSTSFLEPLYETEAAVIGCPSSKMGIPEYYKHLEQVGAVYNINVEKVVALKPDLVIALKGMNDKFVPALESNNIPVIVLEMKSYDQVKHCLGIFAKINGTEEKGAAIIAAMDEKIASIKARLPKETKRVAILHTTAQDVTVQLDASIAGSIAKMLGFTNTVAAVKAFDDNADSAPYSLEVLVKENPDAVFVTSMGDLETIKKAMRENVENSPAWQTLRAVRENRVYFLPQKLFLLNPGIKYPEAAEVMAGELYPEVFADQ